LLFHPLHACGGDFQGRQPVAGDVFAVRSGRNSVENNVTGNALRLGTTWKRYPNGKAAGQGLSDIFERYMP
jgi:hypothetical protein